VFVSTVSGHDRCLSTVSAGHDRCCEVHIERSNIVCVQDAVS
jgi:hypothetical protein